MYIDSNYEVYTQKRITNLRMQKGVSARDMSLSMGQNASYINQIENGRVHPSLQAFFYICDYLKITPHQFFEDDNPAPKMLEELIEELKKLDAKTLELITDLVKQLNKGKEQ